MRGFFVGFVFLLGASAPSSDLRFRNSLLFDCSPFRRLGTTSLTLLFRQSKKVLYKKE